jgi:methionyl-tRNA formyltransferase
MKIVFLGTPDYVLPVLEALHKKFRGRHGESPIAAVVTQRPRPTGRKQLLTYSPVDTWAHKRDIPIYFNSQDLIKDNIQADLGVLAAYGEILPQEVISFFPHGILNIHPSLLPKYRGASPVQGAILNGDHETGVTIMKVDEKMDHGAIVSQFKEDIFPEDTTGTLRERLFNRSTEVICELIEPYLAGKIKAREQNHEEATFTKTLKKEDGFIDLTKIKPEEAERFVRAMNPWPSAWTRVKMGSQEKRLRILKASLKEEKLILEEVQLEGKNVVSWKEFKQGYPEAKF